MRLPTQPIKASSSPLAFADSARKLLERLCPRLGLDESRAELLGNVDRAIFKIPAGDTAVVVRISRPHVPEKVTLRELDVARWLKAHRVPAIEVFEDVVDQPIVFDDHPITVWHYVEPDVEPGSPGPGAADLGELLHRLHALPEPDIELPRFDPIGEMRQRLDAGLALQDQDEAFLRARVDDLEAQLRDFDHSLTDGPIHGDSHTGNILGKAGSATLSDLTAVSIGSRDWDLVPVAVEQRRFDLPDGELYRFFEEYGSDIRERKEDFQLLQSVRELSLVTWLAQFAGENKAVSEEVSTRLASLRTGEPHGWTRFTGISR